MDEYHADPTLPGATTLQVYTDVITPPSSQSASAADLSFRRVYPDISFAYALSWNIRVLSIGNNADSGQPVAGLLYVPDLDPDDECVTKSADWVPDKVTRKQNLPDVQGEKLVAMAPWLPNDPDCSAKYLAAAQADSVKGFIFFLPGNSAMPPPPSNRNIWNLEPDSGGSSSSKWQTSNPYPVFAIPGISGTKLLEASAAYSRNMSDVPYGSVLEEYYPSEDYVRLVVEIDMGVASALPSLWILLLIVVAVVLGLMGSLSLLMHWLQRRRRKDLRRRVENGEVDLEALGIKRLTVPKEVLDMMPLYTYGSGEAARLDTGGDNATATETENVKALENGRSSTPAANSSWPAPSVQRPPAVTRASHTPTALLQPTCPICLEEFIPPTPSGTNPGTTVRELPCQHIFHPECVDSFLSSTSSLCPMCKTAALPKGYCPRKITNAMVRRERMVRRRGLGAVVDEGTISPRRRSRMVSWGAGVAALPPFYERRRMMMNTSAAATTRNTGQAMTEMTPTPAAALVRSNTTPTETVAATEVQAEGDGEGPVQPPSNARRREWARQRAVAMLGRRYAPVDPDAEEARTMPRWRKAVLRVFPAMGR